MRGLGCSVQYLVACFVQLVDFQRVVAMDDNPKTAIYVDISSCVGRGKTTVAHILKKRLEDLGAVVDLRDYDVPNWQAPILRSEEELKKIMGGEEIVIRTRQLPRNPQKDENGQVPPGTYIAP